MALDYDNLRQLVPRLKGRRVVVLGDLVVDEFIFGEMKRVYGDVARTSREVAFGLVLRQQAVDRRPGGAANAINNLLALGARPIPFGFVGNDEAGKWLRSYFRKQRVDTKGIREVKGWVTPTKSRIAAGSRQSASQQVLRLDREELSPPSATAQQQLHAGMQRALKNADALLIADYGYGAAVPQKINPLLKKKNQMPVILDSRYRAREFRGISVLTPSVPELEEAYHAQLGPATASLVRAARRLLQETSAETVLLTRGRQGMLLIESGQKPQTIPIFGEDQEDQVADVTGAGDTVAAAFTAALAAGAEYSEAARLANIAGGLVVMKRGTATINAKELLAALPQEKADKGPRRRTRRRT
jgi:rfaE bifunctional protein kinase chain/domain